MDGLATSPSVPTTAPHHRTESALRATIVRTLRAHGLAVDEQVASACGTADIVTQGRDAIWEVKLSLHRRALQQAIGQLMLYRLCLNPEARTIVVGYPTPESASLAPHLAALGIEVVFWHDADRTEGEGLRTEKQGLRTEDAQARDWLLDRMPLDQPPAPRASSTDRQAEPATLVWAVRSCALARGIASVRTLSFAVRTARQSIHPLWHGTSKCISLSMLARVARTLEADPGGWFRWSGDELIWNIHQHAEAQGLSLARLAQFAQMAPHALRAIWNDTQQQVFLTTLAKLAHVLQLDVGQLLAWQDQD